MLKKLMAVVLVGLLAIGSMAMMATAAEPVTSLIYDFEDQTMTGETGAPTGWYTYLDVEKISLNEEQTVGQPARLGLGSKCLEFDDTDTIADSSAAYFSVTLKPNTTYVLSAWTKGIKQKADGTADYVYGRIILSQPGQNSFNGSYYTRAWSSSSWANAQTWYQIIGTPFTTGDEEVTTQIWVRGTTGGKIWYDNIALYEIPEYEANATYPTVSSNANYINGSFENLPYQGAIAASSHKADGWTISSGLGTDETAVNHAVVSADKARTGQYSLKMKANSANYGAYTVHRTITGLTAGKAYRVRYYVNQTGAAYLGTFVSVKNGTGASWNANMINMGSYEQTTADTSGKWVEKTTFFIAPDSGSVNLAIHALTNYNNYNAQAYIDDISIDQVSDTGIFDVQFYDNNANPVDKLTAGVDNNVKLYVNGVNPTDAAKNYTLLYATYSKEGEITEMKTVSLSQENLAAKYAGTHATEPGYIRKSISVTVPAGQTLKVFVFDNLSALSTVSVQTLS